ncbi:MAG: energy transducer TonB [Proteobacteria bacterium]|nr:energy transducer TonB [Pseudomonadota bacterium]
MFDATTGESQQNRKSPMAGFISLLLHVLVGVLAFVFLFSAKDVIKPPVEVEVTFYSAPPPPPPPPAPSTPKKKKKKKKKKKPKIEPQELVQPEEIPEEIPEEDVEETGDGPEEVVGGGVPGGVQGGVEGGKVGGQIGGVKGGTGTDIAAFGLGESVGRAMSKPRIAYPEEAKMMELEGTVQLRILVDVNGKVVKAKDAACEGWHKVDTKTRRRRWHGMKCIEAVSGPEALYYETIQAWSGIKWMPYKTGDTFTRYWANVTTSYKLN